MKKKKTIEIAVQCNHDELKKHLKEKTHPYIKAIHDEENDVALEMLWSNHGTQYTSYNFVGNLQEGKITGTFLHSKPTEDNSKAKKIPLKDRLKNILYILAGIAIVLGLPFLIVLAITDSWQWGAVISSAVLVLILALIFAFGDNTKVHEKNLKDFFSDLNTKH